MGLFGKLFGKKDTDDEIDEYNKRANASQYRITPKDVPQNRSITVMGLMVSKGGYHRAQTLKAVDALNAELTACTDAKNSGLPMPPHTEISMPKEVLFGGFDKQDTDAYISDLKNMIEQIRRGG